MTDRPFASVDDYERFLAATIASWPAERRVALAAAMAERWVPAYAAFAKAERWGDPAPLYRAIDVAWARAQGRPIAAADASALQAAIDAVTPHMDDFDAYEALAATAAVAYALRACLTPERAEPVVQAALSGFHGVEPEWDMDPDEEPRLWKRPAIRAELGKQLATLDRVRAVERLDERAIARLRAGLADREVVGRIPRPAKPAAPPGHPNAAIFGFYRSRMESNLRRPGQVFGGPNEFGVETMIYCEWLARYSIRLQTISGQDTRFADVVAQQALVARNRARDAAVTTQPAWPPALRDRVDLVYANRYNPGLEVRAVDQPHAYGPSLRALWAEAKRAGRSDAEAWAHILAWAHHRPDAWAREDARRARRGKAAHAAALAPYVERAVAWTSTDDPDQPWAAKVDGARWRVRLNDFPDDVMYALLVDDAVIGDLHDWPAGWTRDAAR